MVFSAFYLIMIRYRIGLRCIILLDCYIMNKKVVLEPAACRYIDRRENMRKKWISIICAILIMVCTITAPVYAAGIFLPEESNTRQQNPQILLKHHQES